MGTTYQIAFATFREASEFAEFAAQTLRSTFDIVRREVDDGFEVWVEDQEARILRHSGRYGHLFSHVKDYEADERAIEWEPDFRASDDASDEIGEDLDDSRESSARSSEGGWYHDDET